MQRLSFVFFFVILVFSNVQLYSAFLTLTLSGHLGKEEVNQAETTLAEAKSAQKILVVVNSSSGELDQVLKLVKRLYTEKISEKKEIIVYIENQALGPAAMIPFLADALYISYFVSWGDIPLGSFDTIPTNILRNTVKSLISSENPHYKLLTLMAVAMSDPDVEIAAKNGWSAASIDGKESITSKGETLVVNHNQLKELGLVSGTMTIQEFKTRFEITGTESVSTAQNGQAGENTIKRSLMETLEQSIPYADDGPNTIGLIRIDNKKSQISQATWIYVKNALDFYREIRPVFVILELNTPGGEVFSAQKISDALKDLDTQDAIPVICFINNWAISAGAMLAYSCRFIAVTKDASMGAAEPVIAGQSGEMVAASEKVNSALRSDFASRARFFDRNPDIAEAMVDKDIILVQRYGRIVRLDNEEQIRREGPNPDKIISPKGKLLTLSAAEMLEYDVADLLLVPEKTGVITEAELESGKWPADKMLLFKSSFFKEIPNATVEYYQMDLRTRFLVLISTPLITSLLFLGMLLGFYLEVNTPGFGFPGSIALLSLFLLILSSFALEVANMLEMILLLVGMAFIVLDLFLIPTFGILGIAGVFLFFIGLFGMLLPAVGSIDFEYDTQTFNAAGEVFIQRLGWLSATLIIGVGIIALLGRYVLPKFSGFQRFVLTGGEETKENGYYAGLRFEKLPQPGSKGEAMTPLRPSGKIVIADEIYDAITYGAFIEKGTPIVVEILDGGVIIVNQGAEET